MSRLSVFFGIIAAATVAASNAAAVDVCSYSVMTSSGFLCPVFSKSVICISQSAITGACGDPLRCVGGFPFFCDLKLAPKSGPAAQCPFGSTRPRGLRCVRQKILIPPLNTPTPTNTAEPTATPTNTAEPPPAGQNNKSAPLAVSSDGTGVVAVNTDTNSVSFFAVDSSSGLLTKLHESPVGHEPRSVALPLGIPRAYVANTVDGTVQVLSLDHFGTVATITVGTEPYALVASPNGHRVYVANASSNTVSVIDTATNAVIATIALGRSPRALAVTNDGDADDFDEQLYVPNFFARPRPGFVPPSSANLGGSDGAAAAFPAGSRGQPVVGEGIFDDSREGAIDVVSTMTNTVVGQVVLAPMADTGFNFARGPFVNTTAGDAPRTIFADGGTDGTVAQPTGAFPNLLQSIVLFGGRGFVPNSAASPEPPLRQTLNVQSLVSVFEIASNAEITDQTFNMNRGINNDLPAGLLPAQIRDNTDRMFPSVPVDIACSQATNRCWVVSQGSDFIVRMDFDGSNKPTINAPTVPGPFAVSPVIRIFTIDTADPTHSGRNPRGIALNAGGTIGYVVCPTTRDVVVADLVGNTVLQRVRSADLPAAGSFEESLLRGKIDFFTSRPFWSDRGWGGCASCHPDGRTDQVTWSFEAGPRQTVDLAGTFSNVDHLMDQRLLNWSPVRDENPDFEQNTRSVFGGRGFITTNTDINMDGIVPDSDPNVHNYGPASSNRALQQDDITNWIAFAVRSAIAPPSTSGNPSRGRDIFGASAPAGANCVACHSGAKWTTSRVTYDPVDVNPAPGTDTGIVNTADPGSVFLNGFNSAAGLGRACEVPAPAGATQRLRVARQVGTFTATNPIEVRHPTALGPVNTVAPMLTVVNSFGADGFNTPSLLGIFDDAPYFRAGQADTLEEAFGIGTDPNFLAAAQAHWRAGTSGMANILDSDPTAVTDLISFLRTIDDNTPPFPAADLAPNDATFADASALCDCQKNPPLGTPALDCTP
jgi:YVTN family beta-propeller protein